MVYTILVRRHIWRREKQRTKSSNIIKAGIKSRQNTKNTPVSNPGPSCRPDGDVHQTHTKHTIQNTLLPNHAYISEAATLPLLCTEKLWHRPAINNTEHDEPCVLIQQQSMCHDMLQRNTPYLPPTLCWPFTTSLKSLDKKKKIIVSLSSLLSPAGENDNRAKHMGQGPGWLAG